MNSKTYIQKALRTESKDYSPAKDLSPRLEHAVFGLVTEAGELMDQVKRVRFYKTKLDRVNLAEEVGDLMWYLALLCHELNLSFEEVWRKNIAKLKSRYPEHFDDQKAIKRDLKRERKILEG